MFNKKGNNNTTPRSGSRLETKPIKVVTNQQWIPSSQLEVGMYVNELDVPWEQTRFMFQGFYIDTNELLYQVQDACEKASVQIEKLARVPSRLSSRLVGSSR